MAEVTRKDLERMLTAAKVKKEPAEVIAEIQNGLTYLNAHGLDVITDADEPKAPPIKPEGIGTLQQGGPLAEPIGPLRSAAPVPEKPPQISDIGADERSRLENLNTKVGNLVSGNDRKVAETEAMNDWSHLPEVRWLELHGTPLEVLSLATSDPKSRAEILRKKFPDLLPMEDEKGNWTYKSSMDGKDYADKPGVRLSDIPGMIISGVEQTALTALTGGAGILARLVFGGALQSGHELLNRAMGAKTDHAKSGLNVGVSALAEGLIPTAGNVAKGAANIAENVLLKGAPQAKAFKKALMAAQEAERIIDSTPKPINQENFLGAMKDVARTRGGGQEIQNLGRQMDVNPGIIKSYVDEGVDAYFHPDAATKQQYVRTIMQAVKANKGSELKAQVFDYNKGLLESSDLMLKRLGASDDIDQTSFYLKKVMSDERNNTKQETSALYNEFEKQIGTREVKTDNVLKRISEEEARFTYPDEEIDPVLREIKQRLTPRKMDVKDDAGNIVGSYLKYPKIGTLENEKRKIGMALKSMPQGPYEKMGNKGFLKSLYGPLDEDYKIAAEKAGLSDLLSAATSSRVTQDALEENNKTIFGKLMKGHLVTPLTTGMARSSRGNSDDFVTLVQALPKGTPEKDALRKEVISTGLYTAFGGTGPKMDLNKFYKFWGALESPAGGHGRAKTALLTNLPEEATNTMKNWYNIAKGVALTSKEYTGTGVTQTLRDRLAAADTVLGNFYHAATETAAGPLVVRAGMAAGGTWPGIALQAILGVAKGARKGLDPIIITDKIVALPEFQRALITNDWTAFTKLPLMKKFMRAINQPEDLNSIQQFIKSGLQTKQRLQATTQETPIVPQEPEE